MTEIAGVDSLSSDNSFYFVLGSLGAYVTNTHQPFYPNNTHNPNEMSLRYTPYQFISTLTTLLVLSL